MKTLLAAHATMLMIAALGQPAGAFTQEPPFATFRPIPDPAIWIEPEPMDVKEYKNNAFDAYTKALDDGKYTVLLFKSEFCGFCKNMVVKLGDEQLAKYSDQVVLSVTNGDFDKGARQLEEALKITRYPTLVILKTNSKNIHVAGRIEGEVAVEEIDRIMSIATEAPIKKDKKEGSCDCVGPEDAKISYRWDQTARANAAPIV